LVILCNLFDMAEMHVLVIGTEFATSIAHDYHRRPRGTKTLLARGALYSGCTATGSLSSSQVGLARDR